MEFHKKYIQIKPIYGKNQKLIKEIDIFTEKYKEKIDGNIKMKQELAELEKLRDQYELELKETDIKIEKNDLRKEKLRILLLS